MDEEHLNNCNFVPFSTMERVFDIVEGRKQFDYYICRRNLYQLQKARSNNLLKSKEIKDEFQIALHHAIYSHDWDKLLYLLKKSHIIEHYSQRYCVIQDKLHVYVRALIILLMYHPKAKSMDLLREYMHMVCTMRTDVEKKALARLILTLPKKFYFKEFHKRLIRMDDDE